MNKNLAIIYALGAERQLTRYRRAVGSSTYRPEYMLLVAVHEASNLLEDLDTIQHCIKEEHALNKQIHDMRNHIRHDIREKNVGDTKHGKRRTRMGIKDGFNGSIEPRKDAIAIGEQVLTLSEAASYIKWAKNQIPAIKLVELSKTNAAFERLLNVDSISAK